ncbi:uncharacterized protein F13E9.13, mitochondrial [Teleopsis dalmanni]|uniref:uncharacterized protein F13E9.13, mitochondrial n=1 Tax=Teleopsis dalmanni TaxID=139649 RepID=UPI0018CC9568|nr:uncharacterized protein F13E9.13, mitochondrial [Teleopsis dalmanni]
MNRFLKVFNKGKCHIIGMIHVDALPGTPKYAGNWNKILEKTQYEANVYNKYKLDAVLIENMHDVPYVQATHFTPETVACMTHIGSAVKQVLSSSTPLGMQILACGNREALAVAKAIGLQFIRAEGFVFGHVADEGYTDACAGQLLRYRRQIDADNVLILTDLKKKHSAHAITQDVSLLETAKAAEFFLTDGVIITGNSTGHAASPEDLNNLTGKIKSPILIGSGVTTDNFHEYYNKAQGVIIGSHFKINGQWENDLCEKTIDKFMQRSAALNETNAAISISKKAKNIN